MLSEIDEYEESSTRMLLTDEASIHINEGVNRHYNCQV